ncbi:hypothetical protein FB45DRAFT_1035982 [Roridomyces roridus]|uniref:Zn(2)-C6 fungal-type domain-containing protein n=1 Tax=Roridomyces roridus TaxID=1738132 RepID=A0AAD7B9V1_9AGAR|nr:hypothetical protein FB45DRAFT_1035982 [Roridomyces roridus]
MSSPDSPRPSYYNIQRGRACSNCRSRKLKCDGVRPICGQCRNRPPRSGAPCLAQADPPDHQTPAQMQETIQRMRSRIQHLERSSEVPLSQPYASSSAGSTPPYVDQGFEEPPKDVIKQLIETFLNYFRDSGYFFMEPSRFFQCALIPLPIGHIDRPSPALLSVTYLWGCVLGPASALADPYTEDGFLLATLNNLAADIRAFAVHPKLILETLQAEILLSFYFLHVGLPVQGRYHAGAAASLALSAGLHRAPRSPQPDSSSSPPFPLAQMLLPADIDAIGAAERIGAFWSVMLINNYWVASHGCPSAISCSMSVDTPWPGGSRADATLSRFLNGDDREGNTPVAFLVKASILLERIVSFSVRSNAAFDASGFDTLDKRLQAFRSALPHVPGNRTLFVARCLTELAVIRLHGPLARTAERAQYEMLGAAGRVVSTVVPVASAEAAFGADPILGPLCATVGTVYIDHLTALRNNGGGGGALKQYQEMVKQLRMLVSAMEVLAHGGKSPVMGALASIVLRLEIWI